MTKKPAAKPTGKKLTITEWKTAARRCLTAAQKFGGARVQALTPKQADELAIALKDVADSQGARIRALIERSVKSTAWMGVIMAAGDILVTIATNDTEETS